MPSTPILRVSRDGAAGFTDWQLRHLPSPSRGTRLLDPALPGERVRMHAAVIGSRTARPVLADVAAARSWQLPLPPWIGLDEERPVSLAVRPEAGRARAAGVRGRRLRLPDEHVTELRGLPITTPARTWLDCAALMPTEHLVAMGDAVLRRGLADRDELQRLTTWARRRRGVVSCRRALPLLDPAAESPGESIVRYHLVMAGLPWPVCNLDIIGSTGWLARADLAWPDAKVIVEYDGAYHADEARRRYDAARRNLLQDEGWLVIVLTADDLRLPWHMVDLVRSALATRTPSLG